jgi:hypothetical protein
MFYNVPQVLNIVFKTGFGSFSARSVFLKNGKLRNVGNFQKAHLKTSNEFKNE